MHGSPLLEDLNSDTSTKDGKIDQKSTEMNGSKSRTELA